MIYITKYYVTNTWGFITLILHMCSWQLSNQQILRLFHDRNSSFGPAIVHNTYTLLLVQTLITQFTLHNMASHLLIHSFSILNKWLGITWCKQISTKQKIHISVSSSACHITPVHTCSVSSGAQMFYQAYQIWSTSHVGGPTNNHRIVLTSPYN